MADIRTELTTIEHGRYGRDIRDAIHDALDKINSEIEEEDDDNA